MFVVIKIQDKHTFGLINLNFVYVIVLFSYKYLCS